MVDARIHARCLLGLLAVFLAAPLAPGEPATQPVTERTFRFTYSASVRGLSANQAVDIWLPVAPNNAEQQARIIDRSFPAEAEETSDPKFGNHLLHLKASASSEDMPVSITYLVTRHAAAEEPTPPKSEVTPVAESDDPYLQADALVPAGGKTMSLLAGRQMPGNPLDLARLLYDTVNSHMQYRKDKPGYGRGDAVWACDSGFGNCTDFHSLFISLARGNHLPARFEIGFAIPEARGKGAVEGYHCWSWFKPTGHNWIPVDISEANRRPAKQDYFFGHLDENRVAFTTGRDLMLSPAQHGPALNYLIYPYVEVNGQPWPVEKISRTFSYEDVVTR